jgi:type IV pilus assembly protein PilN
MIKINLLPVREARRKANLRQQGILLGIALIAAVVVCGTLHTAIAASISSERGRVVAAQAELGKLEETLKEVERFRQEKEDIERKLRVIHRLEESRSGPVRIMDEISSRIPDRMWLKAMSLRNGVLEIDGFGIDNEVIAAFMTSLEESKFLTEVELQSSQLTESKGLKLNEFKITCRDVVATAARQADKAAEKQTDKKDSKPRRKRR